MNRRRVLPAPVVPQDAATAGKPERAIHAVVRKIPRGHVATYGEVAELAGMPRGHRLVARALRTCPESLPWYRVIGKKDARRGQINIFDPDHAHIQRTRLEAEGVEFDAQGLIPLRRYGMLASRSATTLASAATTRARRGSRAAAAPRSAGAHPSRGGRSRARTRGA